MAISYEKTGEARELDREISIHLYRVMQEALNNVAKHAALKHAALRLQFLPDKVMLEVRDDEGVGFWNGRQTGAGTGIDA